ncbi:trypsin-like serine peptidase [Streptomyces sp. NPDC057137]|uniref:trypsin-like serine peptidase n=1 Tax=Streptomyces sp. NPDC057137 TaxID=3346030 RepID=UPI00362B89A7
MRVLLPSLAAAVVILATNQPASARPVDTQPTTASATVTSVPQLANGTEVDSSTAAQEVDKYWTPERMKNAIPADNSIPGAVNDTPEPGQLPDTGGAEGSTPPAAPEKSPAGGIGVRIVESDVVGKVFYRNPVDGKNYVCSASAINSPSKQLVATAGHCVNTGGANGKAGQWMENWTYVPRYREGARPYGNFAAKEFRAFNGWINSKDFNWDVAMVTTWQGSGGKIVNVTGGHGLSYNYDRAQAVTVFGYPVNRNGGQVQWWCTGTTKRVSLTDGRIEIGCDFGGGASGGPWLRNYSDSSGLGYINGVTSTITSNGWNRSSYFGDSVKQMFDDQGSRT